MVKAIIAVPFFLKGGTEMRTGQVAKALGCHPDTIRNYEKRGLIPAARRDFLGWRTYSEGDVETIRRILAGEEKEAVTA